MDSDELPLPIKVGIKIFPAGRPSAMGVHILPLLLEIVQCSPLGHLYSVDDDMTEVGSSSRRNAAHT